MEMESKNNQVPDELVALIDEVVEFMHGDAKDLYKAAVVVAKNTDRPRPHNETEAITILWETVHFLLFQGFFNEAARLLWDPAVFDNRPGCVQAIWNAIPEESLLALQGASSMGKSYTPCVWLMLDWLMDPHWTSIICIGPKEAHLRNNVFSTLSRLHAGASLPMPGTAGDLFIGHSRKDTFGGFKGAVIPKGSTGVVLQGMTKAQRRMGSPHPIFGEQGRVRVLVDEIEDCPPLIHQDLANVVSGVSRTNKDRLKIIVAFNPKHSNGATAALVEPLNGWADFDLDADYDWRSKKGWRVLRLDAHRSENVTSGADLYAGIQGRDALDALRDQAGSEDASYYLTFGRGAFPKTSSSVSAVPQHWLASCKGTVVWTTSPKTYLGVDLSNGGDAIVSAEVQVGYISERQWQGFDPKDPATAGKRYVFKRPRPVIFVRGLHYIPGENTPEIARNVQAHAQLLGVPGRRMNCDAGGPGAGIPDVLREYWDEEVVDTLGASSVTDRLIMEEDRTSPEDTPGLRYSVSEQWLAMRRYFEHGFIVIDPSVPQAVVSRLFDELTKRLWKDSSMTQLESKADFKRRNQGRSCDVADALGLAVHIARIGDDGFRPSVKDGCRSLDLNEAVGRPALNLPPQSAFMFSNQTPDELLEALLYGKRPDTEGGCDLHNRYDSL